MAVVGELGDRGLTEDRLDRQRRLLIRGAGDHDTPGGPFAEMRRRGSRLVPYVEAQTGPQARPHSVAELHKYSRGAGQSRGRDTAQDCSLRGRLAIAADAMKERASAPRDSHPRATLGLFTSTTTREALWTSMTAGSTSVLICTGGAA